MNAHDEILEAAFLREDALDAPEIQEHLAGCADCRERLDELLRLSSGLDGLASEEREDLMAAKAAASAGERLDPRFEALLDEHRVRGTRESRGTPAGPSGGSHAGRHWLGPVRILVAAAAVLAIVFFARGLIPSGEAVGDPGADDPYLSGNERTIVLERVDWSGLSWKFEDGYELPPDGHYNLTFKDVIDVKKVLGSARVETSEWSPSDQVMPIELPQAFVLDIEAFDGNRPLGSLLGKRVQLP